MCAIILKVASQDKKFINIACINIVIAANAGGVFSPFGDITTLMIWQSGLVKFEQFIVLFIPIFSLHFLSFFSGLFRT